MHGVNLALDRHPIQRRGGISSREGVVILLVASCRGSRDKLRLNGTLDSDFSQDFTLGESHGDTFNTIKDFT